MTKTSIHADAGVIRLSQVVAPVALWLDFTLAVCQFQNVVGSLELETLVGFEAVVALALMIVSIVSARSGGWRRAGFLAGAWIVFLGACGAGTEIRWSAIRSQADTAVLAAVAERGIAFRVAGLAVTDARGARCRILERRTLALHGRIDYSLACDGTKLVSATAYVKRGSVAETMFSD